MLDHFASSRLRISGAEDDLSDMERIMRGFPESQPPPYSVVSDKDAQTGEHRHKLIFSGKLPNSITTKSVSAVEHLRSALDQCGRSCARAIGNNKRRTSKFPFGDTASEADNNALTGGGDLPEQIRSLFCSFKPYKGGDDLLWALNKLANTQKHDLIAPVKIVLVGGTLDRTLKGAGELLPAEWNCVKNEIVFAITGPDGEIQYDFDLTFTVVFGDVDFVGGQPVFPIIRALIDKVRHIVIKTEDECQRIGII